MTSNTIPSLVTLDTERFPHTWRFAGPLSQLYPRTLPESYRMPPRRDRLIIAHMREAASPSP